MRTNTSSKPQDRSRFASLLTELSDKKLRLPEYNLAERMGHFFDLKSSLTLAHKLQQQKQQAAKPIFEDAESLQQVILAGRAKMIARITRSFIDKPGDTSLKVPSTVIGVRNEVLQTYEPYKRFYSKHQVAMAIDVKGLRNTARDGIAGFSIQLQQVADLDKTLDESMAAHSQELFSLAPKLLKPRFETLLKEHFEQKQNNNELDHWLLADGWLTLFYQDMSELLLAELDLRLQPIFGLLEALDEHTENEHHD